MMRRGRNTCCSRVSGHGQRILGLRRPTTPHLLDAARVAPASSIDPPGDLYPGGPQKLTSGHAAGVCTSGPLLPRTTVQGLTDDVGVAVVAGVLLDHVDEDPPHIDDPTVWCRRRGG